MSYATPDNLLFGHPDNLDKYIYVTASERSWVPKEVFVASLNNELLFTIPGDEYLLQVTLDTQLIGGLDDYSKETILGRLPQFTGHLKEILRYLNLKEESKVDLHFIPETTIH